MEIVHERLLTGCEPLPDPNAAQPLQISRNDLEHLLQLNFDCPTIATMLGVSLRTVHRHMDEYCLTVHSCYTDIDDATPITVLSNGTCYMQSQLTVLLASLNKDCGSSSESESSSLVGVGTSSRVRTKYYPKCIIEAL